MSHVDVTCHLTPPPQIPLHGPATPTPTPTRATSDWPRHGTTRHDAGREGGRARTEAGGRRVVGKSCVIVMVCSARDVGSAVVWHGMLE